MSRAVGERSSRFASSPHGTAVLALTILMTVGCETPTRVMSPTSSARAAEAAAEPLPAGVLAVTSMVELPDLPGGVGVWSAALGINQRGVMVGTSGGHAVVWNGVNVPDDLGEGQARAITSDGSIVVGQAYGATSVAAQWQKTASGWVYTHLVEPASPVSLSCIANDVTDDGTVIVGGCNGTSSTVSHAVVWRNGIPSVLSTSTSAITSTSAAAVNNRGQVAGWIDDQAVVWNSEGDGVDVPGTETLASSSAEDINAAGVVAVWAGGQAYVSSRTGLDLLTALDEAAYYRPHGMNNRGDVVGYVGRESPMIPVVWSKGHVLDLGVPAGHYDARAYAINNKGEIVGESSLTYAGRSVAVLWTLR